MSVPPKPQEYNLELYVDSLSAKAIVSGILHTIFFHRFFPSFPPSKQDVLSLTLPIVTAPQIESAIDVRAAQLSRQLCAPSASASRGQIAVEFLERKRRKSQASASASPSPLLGGWFGGRGQPAMQAQEEHVWEVWRLDVTLATPRTEMERVKVTRAMESTVQKTAVRIVSIVNEDRDHLPPVTSETSPYPWQIILNPR